MCTVELQAHNGSGQQQSCRLTEGLKVMWCRPCIRVFDLVAGSAQMYTELLGDLLGRVREQANPQLIPSLLLLQQGHYRPAGGAL